MAAETGGKGKPKASADLSQGGSKDTPLVLWLMPNEGLLCSWLSVVASTKLMVLVTANPLAKPMNEEQVPPEKPQPVWLTEAMERSGLSETEIRKRADACGCTLQEAAEALTE